MSPLLNRFQGDDGKRLCTDTLTSQKLVGGDVALATELSQLVEIVAVPESTTIIEQNAGDNDIYFILSGSFDILVNNQRVAVRGPGDAVGEMAAIEPSQRRSATVVAVEDSVVAKLAEHEFADIASRYTKLYREIARELSRRLLERNRMVGAYRDKVRLFVISSTEALPIARQVENAFAYDPFLVKSWPNGVFRASHYTLENLEQELVDCDFAVAIAHSDDLTESRGVDWPAPRDNVIFELGLFMGCLGRQRSILMEPREVGIKLPSDLSGMKTISYRFEAGNDAAALLAPACNELRDHINRLGPYNG